MPGTPERPARDEAEQRARARKRKRGLYGPPPRLTLTTPLTGRLLWQIGDWGRASEHIGGRWEVMAAHVLRKTMSRDAALLTLSASQTLLTTVLKSGLPHADAYRARWENDQVLLEPLDFKWSLETASRSQVSRETLVRLVESDLPLLEEALQRLSDEMGGRPGNPLQVRDGFFVAPVHPANSRALRGEPDLPSILLDVDPREFFSPLPGWPVALAVSERDRVRIERTTDLELVERYYRVGAGITGAMSRLQTGLFGQPVSSVDPFEAVASLPRGTPINALLLRLERELTERRGREQELVAVSRQLYPFAALRADLVAARAPKSLLEKRGALGRLHGRALETVANALRSEGGSLVSKGLSEDNALAQLASADSHIKFLASQTVRTLYPSFIQDSASRAS